MDFVKLQGVQFDEQRYNLIPERKSTYIMDNRYREIVIYNPEMQLGAKKKNPTSIGSAPEAFPFDKETHYSQSANVLVWKQGHQENHYNSW